MCVCVCVFVCCVCVHVCVMCLEYSVCVYLCAFNFSSCYQVGLNSPSIIKLDLSSKKRAMCLLRICVCICVHVIALLVCRVRGYMALSLGNDWGDSRRSSDENNGAAS